MILRFHWISYLNSNFIHFISEYSQYNVQLLGIFWNSIWPFSAILLGGDKIHKCFPFLVYY